jgi:arylsulfatase A-like enzyme
MVAAWRRSVFSEYDYAMLPVAVKLGLEPRDARLFMVADRRWKYVHAPGFRPMLFDLEADPQELTDLGADPAFEGERRRLAAELAEWGLRLSQRTTWSEADIKAARGRSQRKGILVGVWDEGDVPAELWSGYRGGEG